MAEHAPIFFATLYAARAVTDDWTPMTCLRLAKSCALFVVAVARKRAL
jgi:hypothetical protein